MIAAGFGYRGAVTPESLRDALDMALAKAGHTGGQPVVIAVPSDKVHFPAFQDFARSIGCDVVSIDPADFHAVETETKSERVQAKRGTGSVAEAAALIAAGQNSRLLVTRVISSDRMASCALAEGEPS